MTPGVQERAEIAALKTQLADALEVIEAATEVDLSFPHADPPMEARSRLADLVAGWWEKYPTPGRP